MTDIRIGVSGWRYPGWRGPFYPTGLPQREELAYLAARMRTVEVNGSFYSLQRPTSWRSWAGQVPADTLMSVKGPRFITHMKRLRDVGEALGTFFASGPLLLGDLVGPFLWQLPARDHFDAGRLEGFFSLLPRSEAEAARLARGGMLRHLIERGDTPWTRSRRADRPLRHAIEVRHSSYEDEAFLALCREHRVAVVVSDGAGEWPMIDAVTADHVYVRLHGGEQLYTSGYRPEEIEAWAERVRGWWAREDVGQVLVYFDNDAKVHAPRDAMALAAELGVPRAGAQSSASSEVVGPGYRDS